MAPVIIGPTRSKVYSYLVAVHATRVAEQSTVEIAGVGFAHCS